MILMHVKSFLDDSSQGYPNVVHMMTTLALISMLPALPPNPQVNRLAAPLAQEINRLASSGAFLTVDGDDNGDRQREAVLLALVSAAPLAIPSADYSCEALGVAALVYPTLIVILFFIQMFAKIGFVTNHSLCKNSENYSRLLCCKLSSDITRSNFVPHPFWF